MKIVSFCKFFNFCRPPNNFTLNYVPAINIKKTNESVLKAHLAPQLQHPISPPLHPAWIGPPTPTGMRSGPSFPLSLLGKKGPLDVAARTHRCSLTTVRL